MNAYQRRGQAFEQWAKETYERGFRDGVESAFKDLKPFLTAEQQAAIVEMYKQKAKPNSGHKP